MLADKLDSLDSETLGEISSVPPKQKMVGDFPQRPIFRLQLQNLNSNAYRSPLLPSPGGAVRRRDTNNETNPISRMTLIGLNVYERDMSREH